MGHLQRETVAHMALSVRTRETATRANRQRQARAELRLSEIVKTAAIADDFEMVDRAGDLDIEGHFAALYQNAETERMRTLVVNAFMAWQKDEQAEDRIVRGSVEDAVTVLKANNPVWLDGALVPAGSDGAA